MNKKVAVIICVYKNDNVEYVEEAFSSIINQTYRHINTFIYIDGWIPDELKRCILSYKVNHNFKVFENNHSHGLAHGLNTLIDIVTKNGSYQFIARMDSDDICYPDRIEKQVQYFNDNSEVDIAGSYCEEFGASYALKVKVVPLFHVDILNYSIIKCPLIHPSVMFRCSVFDYGLRYPINTHYTEDMAFWFVLLKEKYVFGNLDEVLIRYRLNEETVRRRKGFAKGLSEFKLRIRYMFILKRVNLTNFCGIMARLVFHLLPVAMIKYAYKTIRK